MTLSRKTLTIGLVWGGMGALLWAFGAYELSYGRLPELHSRYLATLLSIADSERWYQLLVQYPLLPLVLSVGYPSMKTLLAVGASAISGLAVCLSLSQPNRLFSVAVAAVFVSPLGIELASRQVAGALGLFLLGVVLLLFRRYLEDRRLTSLFYLSVVLGVAAYTTPLALPIGVGMWTFHLLASPRMPNENLAIGLAILTPVVTVALSWAYTEWALASRAQGPVYDFDVSPQPLWTSLTMAPFYFVVTGWTLLRSPKWTDFALLVPPFAVFCTWLLGLSGTAAIGAGVLVVGTAVLAPLRYFSSKLVYGCALVVQILVFWWILWPAPPSNEDQYRADMMEAIASKVQQANTDAVLADPQVTPRVFARAGSAKPFITPFHDTYVPSALSPRLFVEYVLTGPISAEDRSDLIQKHGRSSPPGFRAEWRWRGIRLDQRQDADTPQPETEIFGVAPPAAD